MSNRANSDCESQNVASINSTPKSTEARRAHARKRPAPNTDDDDDNPDNQYKEPPRKKMKLESDQLSNKQNLYLSKVVQIKSETHVEKKPETAHEKIERLEQEVKKKDEKLNQFRAALTMLLVHTSDVQRCSQEKLMANSIKNPLVCMIPIAIYSRHDLPSIQTAVEVDVGNVQKTFGMIYGYKCDLKKDNNEDKLFWTFHDIDQYLDESAKAVNCADNNYDSVICLISCHGGVDSNGNESILSSDGFYMNVHDIFNKFSKTIKSKKVIIVLNACRGPEKVGEEAQCSQNMVYQQRENWMVIQAALPNCKAFGNNSGSFLVRGLMHCLKEQLETGKFLPLSALLANVGKEIYSTSAERQTVCSAHCGNLDDLVLLPRQGRHYKKHSENLCVKNGRLIWACCGARVDMHMRFGCSADENEE